MPARRGLGGRRLGCARPAWPSAGSRVAVRGRPVVVAGHPQALERGRAGAHTLVGEAVVEPGEDPRDLLEGADPARPAAGGDVLAGAQVVDELLGRLGRLVVEELPVGHDHGRVVARRVALDALEGDLAVGRRLVVADAEVLGDLVPDLVAAHDRAERVGADADGVLAVGVALVLGVEGRDAGDLGGGQVEDLGAEVDAATRDVAVDALHEVQQRQQRRTRLGVAGDDLRGVLVQLREDVRGIRLLGLARAPSGDPQRSELRSARISGPRLPSRGRSRPPRR